MDAARCLLAAGLGVLLLASCEKDSRKPPPLGMTLVMDGQVYAGAAVVDITPVIDETFTDLNGDGLFDGCLDDPAGSTEDCPEPFDDANGNGWFDAVWMGGFSPLRPAKSISDPLSARALVIAQDGQYIAFVVLDLVGLGSPRIHAARDRLALDGFDPDRLIVASTHNHQGPDSMGLWGDPYDFGDPVSGIREHYQERLSAAIETAVRQAAANMEPVSLTVGAVAMRDRSPYFNGAAFGGRNPSAKMHGLVYDKRDPVVVSDQLLVIQGTGAAGGAVFTFTIWSGHPEVNGGENNAISADWVGVTRDILEAEYGGVALHMPECLGGMQSADGGDVPLVDPDGTHVVQSCDASAVADPADSECFGLTAGDPRVDAEGLPVPAWAPHGSRAFAISHGWLIAEAASDALAAGEPMTADPLTVDVETFYVPLHNTAYNLLGPSGIFDVGLEDAITDPELCPDPGPFNNGCIENRTFRIQLGLVGLITAPGEILPELAWGFPEQDPRWVSEAADPTARGPGATYFPQHDPDCNDLSYEDCVFDEDNGDCDCLDVHAWPYRLSHDPTVPPLLSLLDTPYVAALSMVDSYLSYIIPEPDFNQLVSLLSDRDGDHYEDTVSPSHQFATVWQQAQLRLADRATSP